MNSGMYSSLKDDWGTPQELFDALNRKFAFELDVAANAENHKCERYYTIETDGLNQPWSARNWMNPPYGREIGKWCCKADAEAQKGNLTVALLPARTDTGWFHQYCAKWHRVFLRGRLHFTGGGGENSAPFPSMIVYFGIER